MWSKLPTITIILVITGLFPGLILFLNLWFTNDFVQTTDLLHALKKTVLISEIYTITVGLVVAITFLWLKNKIPWEKGIFRRLIIEFLATNTLALSTMWILSVFLVPYYCEEGKYYDELKINLLITFIMNTVIVLASESLFFYSDWRKTVLEKEQLEKENIAIQFEMLKNQLNPHFLFNNMNTLASLVHIDADKAEAFIHEFSAMLRNLLTLKNESLIPLKSELEFAESWIYLQKIRFDNALEINITVDKSCLNKNLPPLTLQLLLENAVKHNVITDDKPLSISIEATHGRVIVKNNLQKKATENNSTGIGLKNLIKRFELLGAKSLEFKEDSGYFTVSIPLL